VSVAEALARAREVAEPTEMVLITGSLYVVGTARAALRGAPTVH
jgi:folylpolyglutamate synthase/dihydropteroate synthase